MFGRHHTDLHFSDGIVRSKRELVAKIVARRHGVNESDPRLLLRQFTRDTGRECLNAPFAICLSAVGQVF